MTLLVDQLGRLFTHLQHQGLGGMGLKMFSWGCQQKKCCDAFFGGVPDKGCVGSHQGRQ